MKTLPSVELLSEVLGNKVTEVIGVKNSNTLEYLAMMQTKDEEKYWTINIYELAHKCKEWAVQNKYYLESCISSQDIYCRVLDKNCNHIDSFHNGTEPEAIFKACAYILEQLSNK